MRKTFMAAALGLLAIATAHAAQPTVVGITGGIPYANVGVRGETFFKASFDFYFDGGTVILSGAADGTGGFYADDAMEITVGHPDGTVVRRSLDFSHGCVNNHFEDPTDVSGLFKPGVNKVSVRLIDGCGGAVYGSSMFLSTH